jgi:hypothetical protein
MFKNLFLTAAILTVVSSLAFAADIDGKWTADVPGRGGNTQTQTLTLKASGNALTGTFEGGRGGAVDISNGTIEGGNVSFQVVREFNGNQFTQQYKGTLSSSGELTLTVSRGGGRGGGGKRGGKGGGREVVFKRAG